MNILIDIGHPAHVHLYRNLYFDLKNKGHHLWVTLKDNLVSAKELLNLYKIPFISIGQKYDGIISKGIMQITYDLKIIKLVRQNKIDIGIGSSINLAHASRISRMKSIILDDDDDDVEPLFVKFAHPFCNVLLSPEALKSKRRKKDTKYYAGYHELAYLHPNRFEPDERIIEEAGLKKGENYYILRFNSFKAHHDKSVSGLSNNDKKKLIKMLEPFGQIFITTEREIDQEFKKYQINIPAHKMHSFLYYATMFIGDSQTMASEAAILGTPAIRSNSLVGRLSYLEEEEYKYGLTFGFKPDKTDKMFDKINELLKKPNLKEEWQKRRQKLLNDKIDVTAFLVWFVENYPESFQIMKENPDFQNKFK